MFFFLSCSFPLSLNKQNHKKKKKEKTEKKKKKKKKRKEKKIPRGPGVSAG